MSRCFYPQVLYYNDSKVFLFTERNNSGCHTPTKTKLPFLLSVWFMEETTDRSKQVKRSGDELDRVQESMEQRKQQVIILFEEL